MNALYLVFGALFGFLLSRARVTDYDTMMALFRLQDFHVAGVMGIAIATAAVGLAWLKRRGGSALAGCPIELDTKPMQRGLFAKSLVFGAGWALSGA